MAFFAVIRCFLPFRGSQVAILALFKTHKHICKAILALFTALSADFRITLLCTGLPGQKWCKFCSYGVFKCHFTINLVLYKVPKPFMR